MKRLLSILLLTFTASLAFADEAEAPTPPPPAPRAAVSGGHTQLFQIILLRGATSGSEELVGLPKNAERAIRDVRDFLPFKSYKLLDSALIRLEKGMAGAARVEGIPPQQYDVKLAFETSASSGKLSIWSFEIFAIRAPGAIPLPRGVAPQAERPVIATSFSIDVGETIVVGSSRLGGDQALIVLFTAVPKT